ncbi:MAG: hypothetical protein ACKODR_12085, partial [Acidimicrobiaceae bacterium]
LPAVQVSNTVLEDEAISFTVDRIGVPVLVRMSYFPNWKVDNRRRSVSCCTKHDGCDSNKQ